MSCRCPESRIAALQASKTELESTRATIAAGAAVAGLDADVKAALDAELARVDAMIEATDAAVTTAQSEIDARSYEWKQLLADVDVAAAAKPRLKEMARLAARNGKDEFRAEYTAAQGAGDAAATLAVLTKWYNTNALMK